MTRITKIMISVLAAGAMTVGAGSSAVAADYSSVNAALADQQPGTAPQGDYGSVNAMLGGEQSTPAPQSGPSSVNAIVGDRGSTQSGSLKPTASTSPSFPNSILGSDRATSPTVVGSAPENDSHGFHWGDALIGAGITFGLALTVALMVGVARRRTRVEPV
jgi:hypothetical protein